MLVKDFIETNEGLVFAIVENEIEQGKVLCFLRYVKKNGCWNKVGTEQANQLLTDHFPHYLYFSPVKEAHIHAVMLSRISKHYQARDTLTKILSKQIKDKVESDLSLLCTLFKKYGFPLSEMGITGSTLIGAQHEQSDIDLVFYSRTAFNQAREITKKLIHLSDCSELNKAQWKESFQRRACHLSFDEYLWHEKRKFNKAIINQRKFDLSFVSEEAQSTELTRYKKLNPIQLQVQVTDSSLAFDYPAEFIFDHPQISSVISYTATYTGQAEKDEWIEVSGILEQSDKGIKRIIVGSSREASGEYIKVIKNPV
jgi:predicted nucleotidyltransferase